VRLLPVLALALALCACGRTQSASQFGEVPLVVSGAASADDAGLYLATQRGYDTAEGVSLEVERSGRADFRIVSTPPSGCVIVQVIVRPDKRVLCADEITLQDERDKVLAVARALRRGYLQAQREPDEAVAAMTEADPSLDRERLSRDLDDAVATWTAGADYFGELAPGPGRDPGIAREAAEGQE
jgi:ABC-type nitrate/sulfonate/bicarbonate transport system substrate-binding protein